MYVTRIYENSQLFRRVESQKAESLILKTTCLTEANPNRRSQHRPWEVITNPECQIPPDSYRNPNLTEIPVASARQFSHPGIGKKCF